MNGDLQHIDDLFKSGLEGKEDNPSPAVWENIEKELDKKDSKPKFFLWWNSRKIAAAALIIMVSAGLFSGGYYLRGMRIEDKESKLKPAKSRSSSPSTSPSIAPGSPVMEQKDIKSQNQPNSIDQIKSNPVDQPAISEQTTESQVPVNKVTSDISALKTEAAADHPSDIGNEKGNKKNHQISSDKMNVQSGGIHNDEISAITTANIKPWKPEQINSTSASRDLPESEKHIAVSQNAIAINNVITPPTSPAAIPVLNKRSASVDLPRFALTPVMSWQFGSNRIVANSSYPDAGKVKFDIDRTESQPSKISGGLLADLRIAKNMTLQSGLIFTSRQIQIEPKYIKAERNPDGKVRYKFDCSAGTYYIKKSTYARPGDTALTKYSTNDLNYLNIPLSLTYHFGGKKFHLFATAGAGLNILTDQYLETGLYNYNYDEQESIATNLKSNYFNGMIGAGINWRAFNKVSFIFSPQYQFAITPMNENMPVKAYPRIFNMQLGMQIRL